MSIIPLARCESNPLSSSPTQLCSFYFDAFNLYHSIVELTEKTLLNPIHNIKQIKWCDLRKLCEFLLRNNKFLSIQDIYFFTAVPTHRPKEQQVRHINYSKILEEYCKIKVINGKFSHKKEKQTDTNLAVQIIADVLLEKINNIFIISNDSDIIPIIKKIKETKPKTIVNIIKPPSAKYLHTKTDGNISIYETTKLSFDIKNEMDTFYGKGNFNKIRELKPKHLFDCLLPDKITLQDGSIIENPYLIKIT